MRGGFSDYKKNREGINFLLSMQNHKSILAESPYFMGFYLQISCEPGNSLTNPSLSFTNRNFRNTIGILGLLLSLMRIGGLRGLEGMYK